MVSYQVNINLKAGTAFKQEFYLTNSDGTPKNITGYKFYCRIAKHTMSIDAVVSTAAKYVQKAVTVPAGVRDGVRGCYYLFMPAKDTVKLPEGKFVYSVVAKDLNGEYSEVVSGLCFIEVALASPHHDGETIFDGGGAADDPNTIILDGGSSTGFH